MVSLFDEQKITSELKGNTLRAYWALLNSREGITGVRELQRKLGFSSPTLAAYHLNKLVELDLAVKERGNYRLVREVKVGVLKHFIKLGTLLLPRYVLYATMFTMFLIFLLIRLEDINFYSSFALMLGIFGSVILWYETVRIWILKP